MAPRRRRRLRLSLGTMENIRNNPNQPRCFRHGMDPRQISRRIIQHFSTTTVRAGEFNVPVLPPFRTPRALSDVQLHFRDRRGDVFQAFGVTFTMHDGDLYVLGFSGANNVVNELGTTLIPGSRRLPINGSYSNAGGIGAYAYDVFYDPEKKENVHVPYRDTLILNRFNTVQHLLYLHSYNHDGDGTFNKLAKALVYIVQLLAEMPRFKAITEHVYQQWYKYSEPDGHGGSRQCGTPLDEELIRNQNQWDNISDELQRDNPITDRAGLLGIAKRREGWVSPEEAAILAAGGVIHADN